MPLLDPDTGNPMTVDATEDSTTTITVVKEEEEDDDEATIGTVEVEAPAIISSHEDEQPPKQPRKKGGLLGRFRRRRKEKQIPAAPVVADKRDQTPSPKPVAEVRESSGTPGTDVEDDDDEEGEWVNKNKNDVAVVEERESLKQVRFPAADAMKSIPIRQRKIVPKAPTARESAFGGPPRYDWIDIVSYGTCHHGELLFSCVPKILLRSRQTDVTRFALSEGYCRKFLQPGVVN